MKLWQMKNKRKSKKKNAKRNFRKLKRERKTAWMRINLTQRRMKNQKKMKK